ncbi:MAG: hypothetical protein AAGH76_05180 [Pseudomonadota bacterium]
MDYLVQRSRPQFHTTLFVLVSAATLLVPLQLLVSLGNATDWFVLIIHYEIIGIIVGGLCLAELARSHAKAWLGYSPNAWCFVAMPIGGAVGATLFWALTYLRSGWSPWYQPLVYGLVGAAIYTSVGWAFYLTTTRPKRLN